MVEINWCLFVEFRNPNNLTWGDMCTVAELKVKPALTQLLVGFKSPLPFLEGPRWFLCLCLLDFRCLHLRLNILPHRRTDGINPSVKSNSSQLMISHSIMKMKRRLEFIALSFVNDSREQAIFYRCVCLLMWIVLAFTLRPSCSKIFLGLNVNSNLVTRDSVEIVTEISRLLCNISI